MASLLWLALPIMGTVALLSLDVPPTLKSVNAWFWVAATLCGLLYLTWGAWLCWRHSRCLAPDRRWLSASVGMMGSFFGLMVVTSTDHFLAWLNSRESQAVYARSTLAHSYVKYYKTRWGREFETHLIIPDRLAPSAASDLYAYLTHDDRLIHICAKEHIGRFGWLWYDNFKNCTTPLEHFATRDMAPTWLSETEMHDQAGGEENFPLSLPLYPSTSYTEVEEPPGSGRLILVPVPQTMDPIWDGLDLNALRQTFPLPTELKLFARAVGRSADRQRTLLVIDSWLFLHDASADRWTWLRLDLSNSLFGVDDSRWSFGQDASTLFEFEPQRGISRRWTLTAPTPNTP